MRLIRLFLFPLTRVATLRWELVQRPFLLVAPLVPLRIDCESLWLLERDDRVFFSWVYLAVFLPFLSRLASLTLSLPRERLVFWASSHENPFGSDRTLKKPL